MLKRTRALAVTVAAVCVDLALVYLLDLGWSLRDDGHVAATLLRRWLSSCLRWAAACGTSLVAPGSFRPALRRLLATHCALGPVVETGRVLLASDCLLESFRLWAGSLAAAGVACFFWEVTWPDGNGESNGTEKKQKARVLFMRVIRLYRPDFLFMLGAFIFLALAVLCEMFIPFYTGKVIDILQSQYQWNEFLVAIVFMGLFSLGSSFSAGSRGGLFMCAIARFTKRIKVQLFGALVRQEIGFFDTTKTGDITSRLTIDTNLMGRAVALNVNVLVRTFIRTLGMLSLMLSLSWKLTVLTLMEMPLTGLAQNMYDTYYQKLSKEVQDSMARTNDTAEEVLSGIRTVRGFNAERSESRHYGARLMDTHNLKTHRDTVRAVYLLVRRLTEVAVKVAMLYYGRLIIQSGQMSTGNLVSFLLYQSDLADNIRTLIYIFGDMLNSVGAAGKVFDYLDREPKVKTKGTLKPDTLKGHVQFQNLTFSYPTQAEHQVFKSFSLELKPGKMTVLVGPSGGGKTTCVSLLERFYQAQQGEILLDGLPLQSYQHKYLHNQIVMVGQEPVLFSGSVKDNITYGLENCSLERVQEAARKANAHEFICQLEKGYDTDVGERGSLLAGGQKQRIAIARALVREPQVLILDEVTSSLDMESENMVQQTLANCPNQTLLVIAHRLKTIERADQIVVIDGGTVAERGTHEELMDKKGSYYRLRERLFTDHNTTQGQH
ncbi:antigen peptide transporter 2-like [Denticeps clupeoides]|uniref:antigen peptide transporter 2-like n=1 Tax=Denticeps clupeoides TaxID=299321 RepID=UPI0010A571FC|nr:antigen peptide transporter 2-like [Denticeps clupeoides]